MLKNSKGITLLKNARINDSDTNEGGWGVSELYGKLRENPTTQEFLPKLYKASTANEANQIQGYIKTITKTYNKGSGTDNYTLGECAENKLWLLSCAEIWENPESYSSKYDKSAEGVTYAYYTESRANRLKKLNGKNALPKGGAYYHSIINLCVKSKFPQESSSKATV